MAISLRSTKRALVDLTWLSSCMSCCTPQSAASTADAAKKTIAASSAAPGRTGRLAPEIIEVEPVVGRAPAVVLEPRAVAPHQRLDHRFSRLAGELVSVSKPLEAHLVAVAAPVEAEHQRDRALQHRGDAHRARWQLRGHAQERTSHRAPAPYRAVRKQADDLPARERGLDLQCRVHLAEPDDLRLPVRGDAFEDLAGFPGVLFVHHHVDPESPRAAGGAHDLEAAEMGAEQHA